MGVRRRGAGPETGWAGLPPSSHQPLPPPAGTLKAKDFKKRCLQATITQDSTYGDEDCLYLNIWVPQGRKEGLLPPPCRKPPGSPRPRQHGAGWGTRRAGGAPLGSPGLLPPPVSRDLPVMIWIYGGAFLMGSGQGANFLSNYLYDGEELATRGNVIVVTFNYRVGPLGFLSTGDANLPGRLGAWGPGGGVCRAPRVLKQLLPAP